MGHLGCFQLFAVTNYVMKHFAYTVNFFHIWLFLIDEIFKIGNIRSRGMYIVWFLTNSSFPVVPLPVEYFLSLLCWTLECSRYWLCSMKCGWIRPLGRSFKNQPMFCHAPFLSARRPAMFLAAGPYWPASWREHNVEQSCSWAVTDRQCEWEIHFLIESHGYLKVLCYHSITLLILTDTHILVALILIL